MKIFTITSFVLLALTYVTSAESSTTRYYLPGTGSTQVKSLDWEDNALLPFEFDYNQGWAGKGFGLTGTQRGAPEYVKVIPNPASVTGAGNQVLAFRSHNRTAAWYDAHPEAREHTIYKHQDGETQDDFFMYTDGFQYEASSTPSALLHVYLPAGASTTALRMPVFHGNNESYPAIWLYGKTINIRRTGGFAGDDIQIPLNVPTGSSGKNQWWTLGMSIMPGGDIQYYVGNGYKERLGIEDFIGKNSTLTARYGKTYHRVTTTQKETIMLSNFNTSSNNTLFDDLIYTTNTDAIEKLDPAIRGPVPGSTLTNSSVTFSWDFGNILDVVVDDLWLTVSTDSGHSGDVLNQSALSSNVHFFRVNNLPTDGSTLYVRLWYYTIDDGANDPWRWFDATYTLPGVKPRPLCGGLPATVVLDDGDSPTTGADVIVGTAGRDIIHALGGKDIICGLDGDDEIYGGAGNDTIYGGPGRDTIEGNGGADIIYGNKGSDIIRGGWGKDTLYGNAGGDTIYGNEANDKLYGGKHYDVCYGGPGNDIFDGCE